MFATHLLSGRRICIREACAALFSEHMKKVQKRLSRGWLRVLCVLMLLVPVFPVLASTMRSDVEEEKSC